MKKILIGACALTVLSAPLALAAPPAPAVPAYELITVRRPVSLTDFARIPRAFYDLCATATKARGLPVKPFVTLPPDFVMERITYSSDGKSFYVRKQTYIIDMEPATLTSQCRTMVTSSVVLDRTVGGMQQHVDIDSEGNRHEQEALPLMPESRKNGNPAGYTVRRTVRGIDLKCLPPGAPGLVPGMIIESCIAHPGKESDLRTENGALPDAYLVDEFTKKITGRTIVEPERLRIGKVDAGMFSGPLR